MHHALFVEVRQCFEELPYHLSCYHRHQLSIPYKYIMSTV
jgi:hypothetical protein